METIFDMLLYIYTFYSMSNIVSFTKKSPKKSLEKVKTQINLVKAKSKYMENVSVIKSN